VLDKNKWPAVDYALHLSRITFVSPRLLAVQISICYGVHVIHKYIAMQLTEALLILALFLVYMVWESYIFFGLILVC
jgi:hypothetical protein